MYAVMAATGIRLGEVRALEWQDLVLSKDGNPYLSITKAVKNVALRIGDTKNGKNRAVPLNHTAFRYLQAWHQVSPYADPTALIFPNTMGKPLQGRYVWDKFRQALERAEIASEGRNLVPHSFRHTFNTLFRRSLDDRTLQLLTGHTTDSMTDNYDHPDTASMIAAIEEHSQTITEVWTRETEQIPGEQAADIATVAMFGITTEDNEGEVPA